MTFINFALNKIPIIDYLKHIILIIILFVFSELFSQTGSEKQNTIFLKEGQKLVTSQIEIIAINDTVIKISSNEDYYIQKANNDSNFFDYLRAKAYKKKWTKEIHNLILLSPKDQNNKNIPLSQTRNSEAIYMPYDNKIIRKIKIRKLKVFGATFNDPDAEPRILGKLGNKIHIYTRDKIIQKFFLFKEGDKLDAYKLSESERLLREETYIEDVKINILPIPGNDSVDLEVMVKDNFGKGISFNTNNLQNIYINSTDNNILGTEQTVENEYFEDYDKMPQWGLNGYYNINNIGGSFINCRISYNAFGNKGYKVKLWRNFFTQNTKYAGELFLENYNTEYSKIFNDTLKQWYYYPLKYRQLNTWIGRAFTLSKNLFTTHTNISYTIGSNYRYFYDKPYNNINYRYFLHNRFFLLNSISLSSIGHYRTNLIYSFGRTEDLPYGILINYTTGIEFSEYKERQYHSVTITGGNNLSNLGFIYFNLSAGSFLNQNTREQGTYKIKLNYFSNLLVIGSYKVRNFLNIGWVAGEKRTLDEKININNFSGIRGYFNDSAIGTKKFIINFESVIFTPLKLADFRFAIFTFADIAWIDYRYSKLFANNPFSGIGIGIRFRNERLVFKTFQIRFTYYPGNNPFTFGDIITISDEWRFRPPDMNLKSPQIIEYQ